MEGDERSFLNIFFGVPALGGAGEHRGVAKVVYNFYFYVGGG